MQRPPASYRSLEIYRTQGACVLKVPGGRLREESKLELLAYSYACVSGYWVGLMIRPVDDRNPPPPLVETR